MPPISATTAGHIAIVVPRFGDEVVGGSERFALDMARALASAGHRVQVITTTARDYTTWAPHYTEGVSKYAAGITVHRFHNTRPRWWSTEGENPFAAYKVPISSFFVADILRNSRQEELEALKNGPLQYSARFIEEQGPFSQALLDYLLENHPAWDRVLFIPYLYPTTLLGSRMIPADKVIIMLAAHNETLIHFPVFREYRRYRWGVFYDSEQKLFTQAVGGSPEKGCGTVIPHPSVSGIRPPRSDYRNSLALVGRASPAKCTVRLMETLEKALPLLLGPLQGQTVGLELVGTVEETMRDEIESRTWVTEHGNVPMSRRDQIVADCMALINPSLLDSMGLVNLEASFVGTPVLVNTDCPAFLELLKLSGSRILGFSLYEPESLARALDTLAVKNTRMKLARETQEWAIERFTPEAFRSSLNRLLKL